jgi:hypothetical protein
MLASILVRSSFLVYVAELTSIPRGPTHLRSPSLKLCCGYALITRHDCIRDIEHREVLL